MRAINVKWFVLRCLFIAGLIAGTALHAATFDILVDKDNNTATGCTVTTPDGPFSGVDYIVTTTVNTGVYPPVVTGVTRQDCGPAPSTFGPPIPISAGGWPVGIGNGTSGYDVLETFFPIVAPYGQYRMAFVYTDPATGSDTVLTTNGQPSGAAIILDLGPFPIIPTLAHGALLLLAFALAWLALRRLRQHKVSTLVIAGTLALIVAGTTWAAFVLDGLINDWTGVPVLATDPLGDAPGGADIAAIFAKLENNAIFVRADVKTATPPSFTSANATTFTVGAAGNFPITTFGIPAVNSITQSGALPAGVSFVYIAGQSTASLAGTPGAGTGGVYPLTFGATNGVPPPASQSFTLTVNQASAITSANNATFIVGTPGTFTFTATGFPKPALSNGGCSPAVPGVNFVDNGNGTATLSGSAALGSVGVHNCTITATNGIGAPATQAFTLTVNKAPTTTTVTSSINPSLVGQSVTFTATVIATAPGTGTPTGTVQFKDGAAPIGAPVALVAGVATFGTAALTLGPHTITADYSGDGNFIISTGSLPTQTVTKAATSTALTSSINPTVFGQSTTFTATVTATPPGSGTPTGTMQFMDGATPIGAPVALVAGVATFSTAALTVGAHAITAVYSGDANFNTSTGSLPTQTVNKAATITAVTSSINPTVFGQSTTFTATVTATAPGAGIPSGTVQFMDGATPIGAPAAMAAGVATFSTGALSTGAHAITAVYSGDGSFTTSTGSLPTQTVNKAASSTAVTSSVNPSVFGQSVTFTATLSAVGPGAGTPGGTVQFMDGVTPVGAPAALVAGVASTSTAALTIGAHAITAVYSGDANFLTSTGSLPTQTVNKAATSTAVTSSINPTVFGQSTTFTATVTATAPGVGTPGGTVQFMDGATPIGAPATLAAGVATFSTGALTTGAHTITAVYSGDGNFLTSTGSLPTQTVNKAASSTAVTSSVNPTVFGQSTTFTATVTATAPGVGTPGGTVQFMDGATPIGAPAVMAGGVATFSTAALTTGTHTMTAVYSGDGNFLTSTGSLPTQTVNPAATSTGLVSSVNPTVFGQSTTFTATVTATAPGSGTPTGTVQFLDGVTPLGAPVAMVAGVAALNSATLTTGAHQITAVYSGDVNFLTSTSSVLAQTVNKAASSTAVISSVNPTVFGQSTTFTATVTATAPGGGTATGTVQFMDGATPIGAPATLAGGVASFSTAALAIGAHSITAVYSGDGNFLTSTGSLPTQTVNKAASGTAVTSSINPTVVGQSTTFTATVTAAGPGAGTPTGTVQFMDGATPIGAPATLAAGIASFSTGALTIGPHTITGVYSGDGNFLTSTGSLPTQTVNQAGTTTAVTSSVNPTVFAQSTTFTATVTPTPPGSGTPTGTAQFLDGVAVIGGCNAQALAGGVATCATTALTPGVHTITAVYSGDASFTTSTSPGLTQIVNQAPAFTSAPLTTFTVGTPGSFPITASGFPAPTITQGPGACVPTLPAGVGFSGNLLLSGTPPVGSGGTYTCPLQAANGVGSNATQSFVLTINEPPVANADGYSTVHDVTLTVPANGVLGNDTGTPPPTVGSVTGAGACTLGNPCATTAGGSVTLQSNGGFVYTPLANFAGPDTFTYIATDGVNNSAPATVTITVTDVAPVVDLNGPVAGINFGPTTFTEGGGPVAIVDNLQLTVTDADSTQLSSATVQITNLIDVGSEVLAVTCPGVLPACTAGILAANVVYAPATGTLTITGVDTLANYQTLLRTLTYNHTSLNPTALPVRDITVTIHDQIIDNSPLAHTTVTVVAVNSPPTVTAPATASTNINTAIAFAGNVSVDDPDSGTQDVQVTLTATNGTATLSTTAGFTTVTGNGTASVVATGPKATQNTALNGMQFTPTAAYAGPATLTVAINDLGNSPNVPLTPLSDSKVINITVDTPPIVASTVPVSNAPAVSSGSTITFNFDKPVTLVTPASAFTLNCSVSGARALNAPVGSGTATIVLTPTLALPAGEVCTATAVAAQIKDAANTFMAADYVFSFTVNALPTVTSTAPTNGASAVQLNATITINFSEPVNASATAFTLQCPVGPATAFTPTPALPATNTSTFILTPNAPLPPGTVCSVNVVASQVTDFDAGQNMAANFPFSFTTGVPPAITSANNTTFTVGSPGTLLVTTTGTPTVTNITMASVTPGPGGTLPTGVNFSYVSGANGSLSGTATNGLQVGTYVVSFTASNGILPNAVQNPFTFNLVCPTITLGPANNSTLTATYNSPFTQAYTPTGGSGSYTYTVGGTPLPSVAFTGNNLTGTPNNTGSFAFTVKATDANNCSSPVQNYTLNVNPAAANDNFTPTTPVIGNTFVDSSVAPFSVTTNDSFPAGATISAFDATSTLGGTVTMTTSGAGLGQFTYDPPRGKTGLDTFTYTLSSNGRTAVGTVSITVTGKIWYIDNSSACASSCDGRQSHPYTTLAAFNTANTGPVPAPQAGDSIFVYTGSGSYSSPLTLLGTQKLFGQGATATLATLTGLTAGPGQTLPTTSGAQPAITASTGTATLTLGSGNTLRGFTLGNTVAGGAGTALLGSSYGTLTASEVSITSSGPAINLNTGSGTPTFDSVSSTGGTNNILLTSVTGTVTMNAGALSGATGDSFVATGGGGSATYAGTIASGSAHSVNVNGKSGGTVTFSGAVTDTDTGISLTSNTGATINFIGGISASTGANTAFNATGGGTVNVCDENPCNPAATGGLVNTLTTTTGTALNVVNTIIGGNKLEFRSISAPTSSASPGIVLNNTGTNGLTVTGTSTTAGTGGTIANKTGNGATFVTTGGVLLKNMNLTNNAQINGEPTTTNCGLTGASGANVNCTASIYLSGVNGFTMDNINLNGSNQNGINGLNVVDLKILNSTIQNAGNESGENGVFIQNLTGLNCAITNSTFQNNNVEQFSFINYTSGTLGTLASPFAISGSTFVGKGNTTTPGGDGIFGQVGGTSTAYINVTGSNFRSNYSYGIDFRGGDTGNATFNVTGNTFGTLGTAASYNNSGVLIGLNDAAPVVTYNVSTNTIVGSAGGTPGNGTAIIVSTGLTTPGASIIGTINGNTIGNAATAASGCNTNCNGISLFANGSGPMTFKSTVTNNQIHQVSAFGIEYIGGAGAGAVTGTLHINSNTIDTPSPVGGAVGQAINLGAAASGATVTNTLCADVGTGGANAISGIWDVGNGDDIRVRTLSGSVYTVGGMPNGAGNPQTAAAVATFVGGQNAAAPPLTTASNTASGGGTFNANSGAACPP